MTDKKQLALELARKHAALKPQSYYAEPFQPHDWVIDAIAEALTVAVPAGYAILPRRLTAEIGAKTLLSGVFCEEIEQTCSACDFDEPQDDCEVCGGEVRYVQQVPVTWSTIKEIWTAAADDFALAEKPIDSQQAAAATDETFELLRIFQTWLGASRDQCDETGKQLWDRIVVALSAVPKRERIAA
ncbi:hypothetical protein [Crenobacter cavernae]|uniref:Uncharacterized protein n=1 Tax=Crenobacter cavernae TaxID=2290923 RepID=A0A345Y6U3_9NEIS|nr:hypothetical protein [Crenobacter cavernae]AXK39645.1 hypothetical protein DWG20_09415 [Crenobacter cavernae]